MILRLVAIVVLLLANAFFVAAEFALVRSRRPRLEADARGGSRLAAFALRARSALPEMLSTSQLGITLSSLGLGVLLARSFGDVPIGGDGRLDVGVRVALAFVVVAYLHLVFGELVPRAVALAQPERALRLVAAPLLAIARLTRPFTWLLVRSARVVARRLGAGPPTLEQSVHSPEELRVLVERSQQSGALLERDAALLEGVLEFSEKNAREVMTPRTEIVAIELDATRDEVITLVERSARSRYPVFDGTIDNIVGVLLAKDLIRVAHGAPVEFSLRRLVRTVHFVPGTREVEDVLADFKRLSIHLAVVLDEYGGTAGIVTMEDLLEEIVGDIGDEYDEPEPAPPPSRSGEIVVPGEMNLRELNEMLGLSVADGDYTTVGGFIFGTLGRVPRVGDAVTSGGARLTVRAMDTRRVESVAVRPMTTGVPDADVVHRPTA